MAGNILLFMTVRFERYQLLSEQKKTLALEKEKYYTGLNKLCILENIPENYAFMGSLMLHQVF